MMYNLENPGKQLTQQFLREFQGELLVVTENDRGDGHVLFTLYDT